MRAAPEIKVPRPSRGYTARLVAPFLFMLYPGTGGAFAPESVAQLERWAHRPGLEVHHARPHATQDGRTLEERVRHVRDAFGLNMSELAAVFNVSRPTVYAWLNGQSPSPYAVANILRLNADADRFVATAAAANPERYVRQPIFDGATLVDLLKTQGDTSWAIARLNEIAGVPPKKKVRGFGKPMGPVEELDDLSTPATHEPN